MITASSTITQIAAPFARIPPLSWRDTRRVTDGRAGLIASRRGGVGAPPRATVPRRRCVVVTANGRHSRSKLRDKEDARERARDAAYRDMRREETRDALVKVDDGAVTVDFKNTGKAATGVVARVKRAHKRAMKKLKKKVDKTVSGLTNYGEGNSRAPTFRAGYQSPGVGFRDRAGYGYYGPPPWISSLVGWGVTLGVVYALGRVFGIIRPGGGAGGGALRLPSLPGFGGSRRKPPPGSGPGRWVKDRTLGGREIWVEDKYRTATRRNFGGAMDSLAEPTYSGGLSERAANERKAKEAKERREAKAAEDAAEPRWWDPPSPGYCPESQREQRLLAARAVYAALSNKRVSGLQYNEGDLAALRERCAEARASVADRVKPESARVGIYKSAVEFAIDAAARRSSTGVIGVPTKFLTGIADDVGIRPGKAGRLVAAAVAARTRAELLQAGAELRQDDQGAAMMTLDKIIGVLTVFTPEVGSAEFEMCAVGLEPRLNVTERRALYDLFGKIGGGDVAPFVAEALGLP